MNPPTEQRVRPTTLFLDFDAVLHSDEVYRSSNDGVVLRGPGALFEHAPALETALVPFPSLRIVLSTSWVPAFGYRRALARLPRSLAARVVGSTYHSHDGADWHLRTRYEQIRLYVERHALGTCWLAVDDDVDGWPESYIRHVVCPANPNRGLQPDDLALLVARLSNLARDGAP